MEKSMEWPEWVEFILGEAEKQGLSVRKLAPLAGVKPDILYKWKHGQTPNLGTMRKVLRVIGYDIAPVKIGRGQTE